MFLQSTVKEVVRIRFAREYPALGRLPVSRFDSSYIETRWVGWDGYVDIRGNRYSVPAALCGQSVTVRIGLDDQVRVYHQDELVVRYALTPAQAGWVTVPAHHTALWQQALQVERRALSVYEGMM